MPKTTYRNGKNALADMLPPQDKKAERALLGSILIDNDAIYGLAPLVKPDDFYLDHNGLIYQAMQDLSARSEPIDAITVMAELRKAGKADVGEGQDRAEGYLIGLIGEVPTSAHIVSYARTVGEMAQRRRLIHASGKIATAAWNEEQDLADVLEEAQSMVFQVSHSRARRQLMHISSGLSDYMSEMERRFANPVNVTGLPTGYVDLDRQLNGLKAQELVIVAGRPGMGKTGLLVGMAVNMSVNRKKRGAIFSLEMSAEELRNRLIAHMVNVDLQKLNRGDLTEEQKEKFYHYSGELSQSPLYINDLPGLSPDEIVADARRVTAQAGLDYIMLDYLGLIDVPGSRSRYEQVSTAARSLKNLAKDIDCPVLTAAQLSRAVENRGDRRPVLPDLRDSGEIEEAADVVLMLYRDEYYNPDGTARPAQGEVKIAKQRNGPTGKIDLFWRAHTASYHSLRKEPIL